jgi:glycosyltransferase involved in cell wall biosynthesis
MRIAQLAPLAETVPPKLYGGSELVVSLLTEELVKRGHEVTLFASADSVTSSRLISRAPTGLRQAEDIPPTRWPAYELKSLLALESMQNQFDLVHSHMGYSALPFLRNLKCLSLSTNHNPVKDYCSEIYLKFRELPFVAISNAYRRLNFPLDLNYVATVYNGIDIGISVDLTRVRRYLLFLGRICSDKGTAEAVQIARMLSLPIVLAGKVDDYDREYFDTLVKPLLSEPGVEYVGEISASEKAKLYAGAIATVCPIKFDEPFGLVFAESLAAGTPVMAFNRGAAAEVVDDGKTGILGDTVEDLISRFGEIENISREVCRESARLRFGKERMANEYEALYYQLLVKHQAKTQTVAV